MKVKNAVPCTGVRATIAAGWVGFWCIFVYWATDPDTNYFHDIFFCYFAYAHISCCLFFSPTFLVHTQVASHTRPISNLQTVGVRMMSLLLPVFLRPPTP
jgi:hypothetical protein